MTCASSGGVACAADQRTNRSLPRFTPRWVAFFTHLRPYSHHHVVSIHFFGAGLPWPRSTYTSGAGLPWPRTLRRGHPLAVSRLPCGGRATQWRGRRRAYSSRPCRIASRCRRATSRSIAAPPAGAGAGACAGPRPAAATAVAAAWRRAPRFRRHLPRGLLRFQWLLHAVCLRHLRRVRWANRLHMHRAVPGWVVRSRGHRAHGRHVQRHVHRGLLLSLGLLFVHRQRVRAGLLLRVGLCKANGMPGGHLLRRAARRVRRHVRALRRGALLGRGCVHLLH